MKTPLQIDIVSDVVCPWCIIGYKRLQKALELVGDQFDITLNWHPFELNPHMPQGGENLRTHLAKKYGTTLEGSIAARKKLTAIGADLGFKFDYFDDMRMYNTFKAHQLLEWAAEQGKQTQLKERLCAAFFGERKAVDEDAVLVAEAAAVGLDAEEAQTVLDDGRYARKVRDEEMGWRERGVYAVPTIIFNGKHMVQGAHEPESLAQVIRSLPQTQPV